MLLGEGRSETLNEAIKISFMQREGGWRSLRCNVVEHSKERRLTQPASGKSLALVVG